MFFNVFRFREDVGFDVISSVTDSLAWVGKTEKYWKALKCVCVCDFFFGCRNTTLVSFRRFLRKIVEVVNDTDTYEIIMWSLTNLFEAIFKMCKRRSMQTCPNWSVLGQVSEGVEEVWSSGAVDRAYKGETRSLRWVGVLSSSEVLNFSLNNTAWRLEIHFNAPGVSVEDFSSTTGSFATATSFHSGFGTDLGQQALPLRVVSSKWFGRMLVLIWCLWLFMLASVRVEHGSLLIIGLRGVARLHIVVICWSWPLCCRKISERISCSVSQYFRLINTSH